jgi:hypothetical protein
VKIDKLGSIAKDKREIIWSAIKTYYEAGLSYGDIIENVSHKYGVSVSKGQLSSFINKNELKKGKNEHLKNDVIGIDEKERTLNEQKTNTINKLSKLSDFELTILDELIFDETRKKSLLISTTNLSMIRKNQMLTKNTKQITDYETIYSDEGKPISKKPVVMDIELNASDLKLIDDGIDKNAMTLELVPRFAAKQDINLTNAQQINDKVIKVIYE